MAFYKRHRAAGWFPPVEDNNQLSVAKELCESGLTFVEIAVSVALLGLVFATTLGTLIVLNRNAASTRLMTNAREIVQRNIETAVGVPFTTASIPSILALTSSGGQAWDEGISGNDPVSVYSSRDGTMKITGALLRIVIAEPNSLSADIRRVTFRLNYALYGRRLERVMHFDVEKAVLFTYNQAIRLGWHLKHEEQRPITRAMAAMRSGRFARPI